MIRKRTPFVILILTALLSVFLKNDFLRFLLGFELVLFVSGILEVFYLSRKVQGDLWLERPIARRNETFPLQVKVKNESRLPIPELFVRVAVRAFPDKEEVLLTGKIMLDSLEEGAVTFAMDSAHCGTLEVRLERIMVQDHLGLFQRRVQGYVAPPKLMFLFPEGSQDIETPEGMEIVPEGEDGSETQRGRQGEDFLGIRPYENGDLLKLVHWKLSARMRELMIKELGRTGESLYWIYLNLEDSSKETSRKRRAPRDLGLWDQFFETVDRTTTEYLHAGRSFRVLWIDQERSRIQQFSVADGAARREMMCALLHTDSYKPEDGIQMTKELPIYDMESEIIEIRLQGDSAGRSLQR